MSVVTKHVPAGDWRTLETFWNVTTTAFFRDPSGARIKIRYGGWPLAFDRQEQTLDGMTKKRLAISRWSAAVARIQIRTTHDADVTYEVLPGDVALTAPIHF